MGRSRDEVPADSVVEGPVTSIQKFGAFVQLAEGVEGMVHVGDMSADKRLNHPQDVFKVGQVVKAQVLEIDVEKRRIRLGMKQLIPTSLDEYIAEHKEGDVVTGRMTDVSGTRQSRIGRGRLCQLPADGRGAEGRREGDRRAVDLSSLTSMLQARWKGGAGRRRQGRRPAKRPDSQLPHRQIGRDDEENRIGARLSWAGR